MWKKKQEGGLKPLWVKCQCEKWNAVQPGGVLKYLEKVISPAPERPPKTEPAPQSDE